MGKERWDREFLDKVIETYLEDFDPIERCIDHQLSSIAGAYDVKISSLGVHVKEYVSSVEDRLVEAIDKKYRWASTPEGVMWAMYVTGHTFPKIAEVFGCSVSYVRDMIHSFLTGLVK